MTATTKHITITTNSTPVATIAPDVPAAFYALKSDTKQQRYRLNRYRDYMVAQGASWIHHDLDTYARHLEQRYATSTAKAHLSTVRSGLRRIMKDRDYLFGLLPADAPALERKAIVDEWVVRLENELSNGQVKTVKKQDVADSEHVRLTVAQQSALMQSIPRDSLAGQRDAAIIGMALATGLRAAELVALTVDDLRQTMAGELAVYVRHGKGAKQRLVPYGAEVTVLDTVDTWLEAARITEGAVFRGVNNKGDVLDKAISTRSFERRLARYTTDTGATPHDLRRSYAKKRYDEGMDILAIRDNLGHADVKTTQSYIGAMDVSKRVPRAGLQY